MNTKLISVVIVSSVSSLLILTMTREALSNREEINLTGQDLDIDENSMGWTIKQKTSSSKIASNLKFEIGSGQRDDKVTIHFDYPLPWRSEFSEFWSAEFKSLEQAMRNYFNDLCKKLEVRAEITITDVLVKSTNDGKEQTHFDLYADCKIEPKYRVTKILQCQMIVANIVKNINVNELLIYFHESSYKEVVEDSEFSSGNRDFSLSFCNNLKFPTFSIFFFAVESAASEWRPFEDLKKEDEVEPDFIVDAADRLSENIYSIEAYMKRTFEIDENFVKCFKIYSEHIFMQNDYFNESSEISIDHIYARIEREQIGEFWTIFNFTLTTFDILITEKDLELNNFTTFDEIFKFFDGNEFEGEIMKINNPDWKEIESTSTDSINYEDSTATETTTDVYSTSTAEGIESTTFFIDNDSEVEESILSEGSSHFSLIYD